MPKSYGPNIDFYKDKLPYIKFNDDKEFLFVNQIKKICYLLNEEFGEGNVVISGSLAMFLYGIRLREHQDECDINIFLLNDTLKEKDDENLYKSKYKLFLYDKLNIPVKLDILKQKIFLRDFYCYNIFDFDGIQIKVENPESLLRYEKLAINKKLGKDKFVNDIFIIDKWITNKNDKDCLKLIKILNEIFGKLQIPYAIAGTYSLWIQGIKLQREFGHDVDIILLCEKNETIVNNIIENEELKNILHLYNINKKLDFVDKHPIIDNNFNKINFKGEEVYVSTVQNFIKTKLRYLREQKSLSNVNKSKFDLKSLSDLNEYKSIIIDYDLLGTINGMNNQIDEVLKIDNTNIEFYNNIKNRFNEILHLIVDKIQNDINI